MHGDARAGGKIAAGRASAGYQRGRRERADAAAEHEQGVQAGGPVRRGSERAAARRAGAISRPLASPGRAEDGGGGGRALQRCGQKKRQGEMRPGNSLPAVCTYRASGEAARDRERSWEREHRAARGRGRALGPPPRAPGPQIAVDEAMTPGVRLAMARDWWQRGTYAAAIS
ncbi:hypothetical protein BDY21DRAFT_110314 [Lineolata rhizophorae]|uniref:Uncharacterized protein n=1 Tax=Lineolata rhizophorae TaxID=578093 RepID=A0A6A6NQL3_9PEZI|nr:hypothetical protein BDY21DRAFT_110314 [Lineolata rhizophorae]